MDPSMFWKPFIGMCRIDYPRKMCRQRVPWHSIKTRVTNGGCVLHFHVYDMHMHFKRLLSPGQGHQKSRRLSREMLFLGAQLCCGQAALDLLLDQSLSSFEHILIITG